MLSVATRMPGSHTVANSHVVVIDSGSPFNPSQTTMQTSSTPRFFQFVLTERVGRDSRGSLGRLLLVEGGDEGP